MKYFSCRKISTSSENISETQKNESESRVNSKL